MRCRLPVATSLTGRAFASARSAWAARPSRLPTGAWSTRGFDVPRKTALKLKERGALVYPKTHKLAYPFRAKQEEVMPAALGVLEEIGGGDETDDE